MKWNIPQYDPHRESAGYVYDEDLADAAADFFPLALRHTTGVMTGKPFELLPWEEDLTRCIFGWVHEDTRLRRYRRVYVEMPRKQGKTTWIAGLSLYMFLGNVSRLKEGNRQCYSSAFARDQAAILFSIAADMVKANRKLHDKCKISGSKYNISSDGGFLRSIPAESGSVHGANAWLIVGDELHAWRNEEFYKGLTTSGGTRSEPLIAFITTAGWDRQSICWREHTYAENVRSGVVSDPTFLPAIWGAEEAADWEDEEVWAAANPSLGHTVSLDFLRAEHRRAVNQPSLQNTFRRLFLNQWTSQETRFLDMTKWRACPVVDGIREGEIVWGGLDLAATTDLTSLCWLADRDGHKVAEWRFWIPGDRVNELASRDHVDYPELISNGWVETCPGSAIDPQVILLAILEDSKKYDVASVGYDPHLATLLGQAIENQGVMCHEVPQTITQMTAPTKELLRLVLQGEISHNGNPVAAWCAENVAIHTDLNQNIRPVKPDYHSSPKKIDGIVALINALHSFDHVPTSGPSIYEVPGGLAL